MTCSQLDDFDVQTTTTYDAFGNVVSEEIKHVISADVPMYLCPPGTCQDQVDATTIEYRFDSQNPATDSDFVNNPSRFYDPQRCRWLSQEPIAFDAGESNLYRYHNPGPGAFLEDR